MDQKQAKKRPKIAAIIPAFNEERTLATVLSVLKESRELDEIIVVSDGSTDTTAAIAKASEATVLELETKHGKGEALLRGLSMTSAPIVVFFDADLRGLTASHVEQLVLPVMGGGRAMNVGLRDRGPVLNFFSRHFPLISGERALRREIIENIDPKFLQGYMVEAALNFHCRAYKHPYGSVVLSGVTIRTKVEKVGLYKAIGQYIAMSAQVLSAMVRVRTAKLLGQF